MQNEIHGDCCCGSMEILSSGSDPRSGSGSSSPCPDISEERTIGWLLGDAPGEIVSFVIDGSEVQLDLISVLVVDLQILDVGEIWSGVLLGIVHQIVSQLSGSGVRVVPADLNIPQAIVVVGGSGHDGTSGRCGPRGCRWSVSGNEGLIVVVVPIPVGQILEFEEGGIDVCSPCHSKLFVNCLCV